MTATAWWTLDELVARVAAALASPVYPGAPNGRVREVPDRRVVRWYTTIGLVDRPAAHRGRTALYGPRHLVQLVAVKRLQADGRSLTEIQARLAGATDATLRRLAGVPRELLADSAPEAEPAAPRRFWAQRPEAVDEPAPPDDTVTTLTGVPLPGGAVLLLPAHPGRDDLEAIQAAAAPLLDLLADRGLLVPSAGDGPRDHRRPRRDASRRRV
jgi:DNA-binding transcriptional MerR regulator